MIPRPRLAPLASSRRRSLHIKNFEHVWSTTYWRPQSRRLNTSLSLSSLETNCRKQKRNEVFHFRRRHQSTEYFGLDFGWWQMTHQSLI